MAMSDSLADMLTRIRNGQSRGLTVVVSPHSKLRINVLDVLQREGYIRGYSASELRAGINDLKIELKYDESAPVIQSIQRVSKPGRRVYSKIKDLKPFRGGLGISILSTPKGVVSDHEARALNVGGEVLCEVF